MTQINKSTTKNGRILSRTFIDLDFFLASPLCIADEDEQTDNDVMKNSRGEPFIPGASIAGALRAYLSSKVSAEVANKLFGSGEDQGTQSPLIVSDGTIKDSIISIRDGVALDDTKQTIENAKFDLEIVEYGTEGNFSLELIIRDNHEFTLEEAQKWIAGLVVALNNGDIQLGMKKNRGFGLLLVSELKMRHFSFENSNGDLLKEQAEAYLQFLEDQAMQIINLQDFFKQVEPGEEQAAQKLPIDFTLNDLEKKELEIWRKAFENANSEFESIYEEITIPLKLEGGLSIRQYSAQPEAPDFQHIQSMGVSIVPGTSWTGALRHQMKKILQNLGLDSVKSEKEMILIFGTISSKDKQGFTSPVRISESRRNNASCDDNSDSSIISTRTKINRFTGGSQDQALFTERISVGGIYELVIRLHKNYDYPADYLQEFQISDPSDLLKSHKGLFYLALKDLCNGFLMVGGQTAIGRGHFTYAENGNQTNATNCFSAKDEADCLKALAKRVELIKS